MPAATYDLNELKRRMQGALQVLKQELGGLRTGRASTGPARPYPGRSLRRAYAAQSARHDQRAGTALITVQVWDKSMVHAVEKAIVAANIGLTPNTEGQLIRLRMPELNQERRKELVKVAHKYAEAARVAVRHVRRDGMDVLKKMEKDGKISRDDHDRDDATKCRRRPIRPSPKSIRRSRPRKKRS